VTIAVAISGIRMLVFVCRRFPCAITMARNRFVMHDAMDACGEYRDGGPLGVEMVDRGG
jgi:hypothetical protein